MTSAQRARLIVSLGIVNFVLASIVLGAGGFELQQRSAGSPPPVAVVPTPTPTTSTSGPTGAPTPTPTGTATPPGASATPTPAPSVSPTPLIPGATPTLAPAGSGTPPTQPTPFPEPTQSTAKTPAPTAAQTARPTPRPTAQPTPRPTAQPTARPNPKPTPRPTARPTPKPTPKPTQVVARPTKAAKGHPPCPTKFGPPPGQDRTDDPHHPCGKGKGNETTASKNKKGVEGGIILIVPLTALTAAWATRPARLRLRRRAR